MSRRSPSAREAFIARGSADWDAVAAHLARAERGGLARLSHAELDALAAGHRRVAADFSHARTHFPQAAVTARLRQLTFRGHQLLSHRPARLRHRLVAFFSHGYPVLFRRSAPVLGTAVGVFVGGTVLGFLLTAVQPDVATLFLGPGAVDGVRQGEIWTDSVSSMAPASVLSSRIFTNNLGVALVAWAGGALLGLLTLYVLVFNGLMFGSVLALTAHYGLLDRVLAFVAAHGPLELFLITVAGAAGLQLTAGLVVSGPRPRAEAFSDAARRSLGLLAGTLPWFVLLGVVEGNVSPVMTTPTPIKAALGVLILGAFLAWVGLGGRGARRGTAP